MRSIWMSLLWKEWHEHKWKLAALTAILITVPMTIYFIEIGNGRINFWESFLTSLIPVILTYVLLSCLFLGMSTAGKENTQNTMPFLQSLTISPWKPAFVKLCMALITAWLPLLLLMILVVLITPNDLLQSEETIAYRYLVGNYGIDNWIALEITRGLLGVTSLLLWMAAGGVNRSDEVRAGAVGFLIVSALWLTFVWAFNLHSNGESVLLSLMPVLPGGPGIMSADMMASTAVGVPVLVAIGIAAHGAVLVWYLRRFGKVSVQSKYSYMSEWTLLPKQTTDMRPFKSQLGSIAWKQLRETGPLSLFTLGGILLVFTVITWSEPNDVSTIRNGAYTLGGITMLFGLFVSFIGGISVMFEEYKPKVPDFWRTIPMNFKQWFILKYVVGITVLALSLGPVLLFANWWSGWQLGSSGDSWNACLLFVLFYSLTLCTYAFVRQPIYAVALALFFGFVGGYMLYAIFLVQFDLTHTVVTYTAVKILAIVFCTTLAYFAVKHDWGWKQGR